LELRISVKVPATSANLGTGFDIFGLALALYTEFVFDTDLSNDAPLLEVTGEGAALLTTEGCALVFDAAKAYAEARNITLPPYRLLVNNLIPLGRGLGSSAAAIVGGLVGASMLIHGQAWIEERDFVLNVATEIEGHPDNVAPALLGGLLVAAKPSKLHSKMFHEAGPIVLAMPIPDDLDVVLFIPDFEMSTKAARAVLPAQVPFGDAIHNLGRAALLAAIFATPKPRLELLADAMDDRLHQPYRTQIFPQLPVLIETAVNAGAYGAALSGAGSSVLAFVSKSRAAAVQNALVAKAAELTLPGQATQLAIAQDGTRTELF
jgi:homoserine kinase